MSIFPAHNSGQNGADVRDEHDLLGTVAVPADAMWGIHRARATANFDLAGRRTDTALMHAFGAVKLACCRTNRELDHLDAARADAISQACTEVMEGVHDEALTTDALQGGAGTSVNMVVNEVIANRACVLLGGHPGERTRCHPHDHVNLHQSTNDTYPTALRIAAIRGCRALETAVVRLQEAFQAQERAAAQVVCLGRTELQDAVLLTMGRRFGAYADAFGRDRWRISKCEERLRVVNLGGTAIGTGLGAPRAYIFRVVEVLREITGLGLARAENLIDGTANADAFAEVSGILEALAVNLIKVADDLRLLSSGPQGGLGELHLPERQEGSSIMPGKVNPVIPESVVQAALLVLGNHGVIAQACARGCLELNPFLPLVADRLLDSLGLLTRACDSLATRCVGALRVDTDACARHAASVTAQATALAERLGHHRAGELAHRALNEGWRLKDLAKEAGVADFDALVSPAAVLRLGRPS